jgi:hypothetical protein
MELFMRVCSAAGIAALTVVSCVVVVWSIVPFVAEAAGALYGTYGY